jgi:hypothetical protein
MNLFKKIARCLPLLMAVGPLVLPGALASTSVIIAQCQFTPTSPIGAPQYTATTAFCIGTQNCGCGSTLTVESGTDSVFSGSWRPRYQSSPELYIVKAVDSGGDDLPIDIEISSTRGSAGNPAMLRMNGQLIPGNCGMAYPNWTQFISLQGCP